MAHCNFVHIYPLAPKKSINLHWALLASEHPKLLQNIGTFGSSRERPHPTRKEPTPPVFACPIARTPRCVPPYNRTRSVSPDHRARTQELMWIQSHIPACGCRAANASASLRRLHADPWRRPSSCSRWLRHVGLVATCATPNLLLQYPCEILATYV
jgi:hypothetical protein